MERKLASVRKVKHLEPIDGADRIELARVDGWQVVVQKGLYAPGDLVIYYEVDSFLPPQEQYEFLRKSSFRSTQHLGDGFKIKSMKLRGKLSQGLLMPISEVLGSDHSASEGDDLTERLNVKKWEVPLSPQLAGQAKGLFPSFIRKTDQERIQNIFDDLVEWEDDLFHVSLKLDGSSMTVFYNNGEFGVCSRNLELLESDANTFWRVANENKLREILTAYGRNIALQGELMGPGIQGNRERFDKHNMFLFDIYDIDRGQYLSFTERSEILHDLQDLMLKNFDTLLTVDGCPFLGFTTIDGKSLDDLLKMAKRASINHDIAEGIVFRSENDPSFSFKVLNNDFLLAED